MEASRSELEASLSRLEHERQRELQVLRTHRALDDFVELQRKAGELVGSVRSMSSRIEELRLIRKGKSAIQAARLDLSLRTQEDFEERLAGVSSTIARFNEIFDSLYKASADLVIDPSASGYKYKVSIPRQGSHGFAKVSIFAYDLCNTEKWNSSTPSLGFLAHDSTVFDGVDERQTARSIDLASRSADDLDYQYVLTINSDDVPHSELKKLDFDPDEHTVLELFDNSPEGGLLGVRL
jgi:uncharacterized protein YydD (DUF2326 family)